MRKLKYQLASWPDEEVVVAEISLGDEDVGHVIRHGDNLELTLYREAEQYLRVDMTELEELLQQIRRRLC